VFPESLVETGELQFNKEQKFFYLSDQQEDEGLVLLQTDSISGSGKSHTTFPEISFAKFTELQVFLMRHSRTRWLSNPAQLARALKPDP
jgi:hypothetical protein